LQYPQIVHCAFSVLISLVAAGHTGHEEKTFTSVLAELLSGFTGSPETVLAETCATKKVHEKTSERKIFFPHKKWKFFITLCVFNFENGAGSLIAVCGPRLFRLPTLIALFGFRAATFL
jgi:hypothetical protein